MEKLLKPKTYLPEQIKRHLIRLIRSSGMEVNEEILGEYIYQWNKKNDMIENEIDKYNLIELDFLEQNDEREAIIMTYSGSIIRMSPPHDGLRKLQYHSIQSRSDVPQKATIKKAKLAYDIIKDEPVDFKDCKIRCTSCVYKIIVPKSDNDREETRQRMDDLSLILIEHSMK